MGAINFSRAALLGSTSETVGYKAGLALTREELVQRSGDYAFYLQGEDQAWVRIRSEDYEGLISRILFEVGNIPTPHPMMPGITLFHRYRNDPKRLPIVMQAMELLPEFMSQGMEDAEAAGTRQIDPTPFVKHLEGEFGLEGAAIALAVLDGIMLYQHASPWAGMRLVEWSDTAELRDLFESESLSTQYGTFFDQRYVDFLATSFDLLGNINWRKFEGLTCEFFEREGFYVEIGEGRNDGSIDARVWPREQDRELPPALLVQCKRERRKVGKVVVKALWADVQAEAAQQGLIVTTTALSPGAREVRNARGYPIMEANRETLRVWLERMRTPFAGVFLAE
jgi:restriction system protein